MRRGTYEIVITVDGEVPKTTDLFGALIRRLPNASISVEQTEDVDLSAPASPHGMAGDPEPEPFGEVRIEEFKGDADGNLPEGVMRLDRIEHGKQFEDRAARFFACVGYGPVQGSVHVEDDEGTHAYYDCDTKVRAVGKGE